MLSPKLGRYDFRETIDDGTRLRLIGGLRHDPNEGLCT